jgi:hypothetical protein
VELRLHQGQRPDRLPRAHVDLPELTARTAITGLKDRHTGQSPTDASVALIYVGLGDNDQAMAWLEKAYQARFNPSILLRPAFDPLRADRRFRDLRARIGLPQN